MALMMGKLYAALRAVEVPENAAREAAEEAAGYESRLGRIESDVSLLKWMVGFNLAMTLTVIGKLFLGH